MLISKVSSKAMDADSELVGYDNSTFQNSMSSFLQQGENNTIRGLQAILYKYNLWVILLSLEFRSFVAL